MDSDASVMEGNDIEALGGGSFRTVGAVRRYSRLDQYAMGLVGPSDVPPFFYVQNPTNLSQTKDKESGPQVGVTFNGTRRDVLIDDVLEGRAEILSAGSTDPEELRLALRDVYRAASGSETRRSNSPSRSRSRMLGRLATPVSSSTVAARTTRPSSHSGWRSTTTSSASRPIRSASSGCTRTIPPSASRSTSATRCWAG